jgi:hypothetical protein
LYRSIDLRAASNHMSYAVHSGQWNAVYDVPRAELCEWSSCTALGNSANPWAATNLVTFPAPTASGFHVTLSCAIPDSSWVCNAAGDVYVRVYGGKLTLRDETNPQVSGAPSGGLMTESVVRGQEDVTVNATDSGSGVYRVQLLVDNVPAISKVVDENGGKCVDVNPANGDAYEFSSPVPCRLSAGGTYSFDTRQLPEGTHNLKILLEDAAGNSATLSNRNVVVDNVADPTADNAGGSNGADGANGLNGANGAGGAPGASVFDRGAPNGTNAADDARLTAYWVKNRGAALRSRYGTRQVIRGRLVNGKGQGIGNARIELAATPAARGAVERLDKGGARTRPDGKYTIILPKDVSSRTLTLRYHSHHNDLTAAATRTLTLKVTAGVRLAVSPRVAAKGKTIRLSGRLLGTPLPRVGKVLELQARTRGGAWVTFSTVRTNRSGSFTSRYTFRRGGPVTYELRIRSRASGDYPYELGTSRAVSVRVR